MTKNELRKIYKDKRTALTLDSLDDLSLAIANKCLELLIWQHDFYHLFLQIAKQREVNTEFLLHILQGKDKNVIVSKSNFNTNEMTHFLLTENTKLVVNSYGIPEPEDGISINTEKIAVVFVPLLCFDKHGNRVGYGKGFYDRFLSLCSKETIKVGLSCFEVLSQTIESSENDISLDYCVTPEKVYSFV